MAAKKNFPVVFVLAPLLAVLAIAGYFGWTMYRQYASSEQEDDEARRQAIADQEARVKAAHLAQQQRDQPPEPKVEPPPKSDEDDLANLPKNTPGRKPVKPVNGNQTPAQRAYFGFKAAYEKLESTNENAARKFRVRKLQLDDQFAKGNPANEAKFVADCEAAKAQIVEALRNPENQ